jgi:predicted DNA binding CopG/RHH family protein
LTSIHPLRMFAHMKMLTIRIPEDLHKAFKIKCVSEGVDMGSVITKLIESYVKESKPKSKAK